MSLGGADVIGPHTSSTQAGHGEVYRLTAARTGAARSLRLYLDASSTASKVVLGLYADTAGEAGALLGTGTITAPQAGAWNTVSLATPIPIVAGTHYWFALLNPNDATGTSRGVTARAARGGLERGSASENLLGLPALWAIGGRWSDGPVSGAVWGSTAPIPPALSVSPTSVSLGSTPDGAVGHAARWRSPTPATARSRTRSSDNAAWLRGRPASGSAPADGHRRREPDGPQPGHLHRDGHGHRARASAVTDRCR